MSSQHYNVQPHTHPNINTFNDEFQNHRNEVIDGDYLPSYEEAVKENALAIFHGEHVVPITPQYITCQNNQSANITPHGCNNFHSTSTNVDTVNTHPRNKIYIIGSSHR